MPQTVKDATDLLPHELEDGSLRTCRYYRCSLVPKVLMQGQTGDTYVRADGKDWPDSAYEISVANDGSFDVTRKPTWGDTYGT